MFVALINFTARLALFLTLYGGFITGVLTTQSLHYVAEE